MAFMSQERKKGIAAELKKIIPPSWKWSLGVNHHSTIVLNIWSAPIDLIGLRNAKVAAERAKMGDPYTPENYADVNHYHLHTQFEGAVLTLFEKIVAALNNGNHDNSDITTDYFDVGWYVDINLGKWDKPFKYLPPSLPSRLEELEKIGINVPVECFLCEERPGVKEVAGKAICATCAAELTA